MNQNKSDRSKMTADPARARVRATGQGGEKKRRGLFLMMDVFLFVGIVGIIFLMVLAFTPLSLFGNDAEPCEILYTVELAGIDQGVVSSFREGTAVTDVATGSEMGKITQIKVREYEAYTNIPSAEKEPGSDKHVVMKETNDALKTVTVVISVTAEYVQGAGYTAEECRIAVGRTYQLRFPPYMHEGVCIALDRVVSEGEVAK